MGTCDECELARTREALGAARSEIAALKSAAEDRSKLMLASMASSIAAGLAGVPTWGRWRIATDAVEIARAILAEVDSPARLESNDE